MNNVQKIAQQFVGVPFVDGGRDMSGLDCYGLFIRIARDLGCAIADYEYDREWYRRKGRNPFVEDAHLFATEIERSEIRPGDAIMFYGPIRTVVSHIGVAIGGGRFIHSRAPHGAIVSRLNESQWLKLYHQAYRLKLGK